MLIILPLLFAGHLGCSVDVVAYLDDVCSGKRACEYAVQNKQLQASKPCPPGVATYVAYLEVAYRCVKGISESLCASCRICDYVPYLCLDVNTNLFQLSTCS